MTGKALKTLTLLVASSAIIFSCSKYKSNQYAVTDENKKNQLRGKWLEEQYAVDSNNNNNLDEAEMRYRSDAYNLALTFNVDGSGGYFVHNAPLDTTYAMTWSLQNNDKDIRIILSSGDTTILNIRGLTDLTLTVSDSKTTPKTWIIYKKS